MNKHTPGPWSQGKLLVTATTKKWTQEQRDRADKSERLQVFANFLGSDEGKCRKHVATCHSEADARLIAAAPELLEALKSAREYIDNCGAQAGVSKAISDIEKAITKNDIHNAAQVLTTACHTLAEEAGWWDGSDQNTSIENPLHFSNKLCLIHSEISEAMEGDRKRLMDDKLPHRPMREVELADAVIRIFDLAGGYGMDLAGAIVDKLAYNASRADHKPENRKAEGGKAY